MESALLMQGPDQEVAGGRQDPAPGQHEGESCQNVPVCTLIVTSSVQGVPNHAQCSLFLWFVCLFLLILCIYYLGISPATVGRTHLVPYCCSYRLSVTTWVLQTKPGFCAKVAISPTRFAVFM